MQRFFLAGLSLAAGAVIAGVSALAQQTYHNERFGFSIGVPANFIPGEARAPDHGGLWISRDRRARFIAVATGNDSQLSLEAYRRFLIARSYKDAVVDYAPKGRNWFVLSGRMNDQEFYERITFACDGRYIYGWQIRYPVDQRRRYDRVVTSIHRSFVVGRGEDGRCGAASITH